MSEAGGQGHAPPDIAVIEKRTEAEIDNQLVISPKFWIRHLCFKHLIFPSDFSSMMCLNLSFFEISLRSSDCIRLDCIGV